MLDKILLGIPQILLIVGMLLLIGALLVLAIVLVSYILLDLEPKKKSKWQVSNKDEEDDFFGIEHKKSSPKR